MRKYIFTNKDEADKHLKGCIARVDLGYLPIEWKEEQTELGVVKVPIKFSDKYSVDAIWDIIPDLKEFEIWVQPFGVHVFWGYEQEYTNEYNLRNGN
jgi:hypothetical protein